MSCVRILPGAGRCGFSQTLRETLQSRKTWSSEREARLDAFRWLNRYNTRRRHFCLGQRSPMAYETALDTTDLPHVLGSSSGG
ncbi:integrase core domain-containing protein [Streptomyces sp. NPDC055817]